MKKLKVSSIFKNAIRRQVTLIEVLIAMFLVTVCIFPLLYPHYAILIDKENFIKKIELDHQVNLIYGNILEKLYLNQIPYEFLTSGQQMEITTEMVDNEKLVNPGFFSFKLDKDKSNEDRSIIASLFTLTLTFRSDPKPLSYEYKICVLKKPSDIKVILEES